MADQDPIDLGDSNTSEIQIPLADKYSAQMRQIVSQKIDLPISTISEMIKEQINLDPSFQRRDRWDRDKQSRFIESIIMNVPIPPVFLGEDEYGMYVVLDGRQRLTAINDFFKNLYPLKGLAVWKELNGLNFNDLQKNKFDRYMMRRFVPAIVILKESSPQVSHEDSSYNRTVLRSSPWVCPECLAIICGPEATQAIALEMWRKHLGGSHVTDRALGSRTPTPRRSSVASSLVPDRPQILV